MIKKNSIEVFFKEPSYVFYYNRSNGELKTKSDSHVSKGRELVISKNKGGYLQIKLNGKYKLIHQIVSEKFIKRFDNTLVVNHIDGNKLNNRIENLEYISRADNIRHAVRLGLHVSSRPHTHGKFKDGRAVKERLTEYKHEWYIEKKAKG